MFMNRPIVFLTGLLLILNTLKSTETCGSVYNPDGGLNTLVCPDLLLQNYDGGGTTNVGFFFEYEPAATLVNNFHQDNSWVKVTCQRNGVPARVTAYKDRTFINSDTITSGQTVTAKCDAKNNRYTVLGEPWRYINCVL